VSGSRKFAVAGSGKFPLALYGYFERISVGMTT
jgi:hypothetical protein